MLRFFFSKESVVVFFYAVIYDLMILVPIAGEIYLQNLSVKLLLFLLSFVGSIILLHKLPKRIFERKHLSILYRGCVSLKVFIISCSILSIISIAILSSLTWQQLLIAVLWGILLEAVLFWNGMLRVFATSVQLGLKLRVIAVICGWIPIVNVVMLLKMIDIVEKELAFEYAKDLMEDVEAESIECLTKYPIVLVHGVFFRDIKYLNYWGRIPRFLKQRGAKLFYGNQESAQSVEHCGKQLAARIKEIIEETGCEKVNIIAHSKGGLDSRYAISNCGMDQYTASLTSINTPHHGCIFANYLLKKAPKRLVRRVEKMYNSTFQKLGDQNPDFLTAVHHLSDEACKELNTRMPDKKGVYYQGMASYVSKAASGKFPLNVCYPIVKHFDGKNDGLVSVESASYFDHTRIINPTGKRGISHADIIDLNRENIDGFDVREFYKEIIVDLKAKGF